MLSTPDKQEMLAQHQFLSGLKPEWIEQIAAITESATYHAKDHIFHTGESADRLFLVRDGLVSLELYEPSRGAILLDSLGANKPLGWSWLVPPYKWTFDAQARVLTRVLEVDAAGLRALMEQDCGLGYALLLRFTTLFAQRLEAARLQLLDMYGPGKK